MEAIPFLTVGGGGAVGWYMRGAMGKMRDPKPHPLPPKAQTLVDAVKAGYAALDTMAKDIHAMYHPIGCKCAMCEIRGDDKDPEPPAGERCANPCFGCTILTCKRHPDHKPAKPVGASNVRSIEYERDCGPILVKATGAAADRPSQCCLKGFPTAASNRNFECPVCGDDWVAKELGPQRITWIRLSGRYRTNKEINNLAHARMEEMSNPNDITQIGQRQLRTAVKNLEAQLKTLGEAYQQALADRDAVLSQSGLQSAGMHIGDTPLYFVKSQSPFKAEFKPASRRPLARSLYDGFVPNPDLTDRENMQALADHAKGIVEYRDALEDGVINELVAQRMARWDRLEKEERRNPGGRMITQDGEGPVRYIPPKKKRSPAGAQF
jgi:hypothetical protein